MKDQLEILSKIEKLEAPAFLLTRIKKRIACPVIESISTYRRWQISVAATVLLMINIWVGISFTQQKNPEKKVEFFVQEMQLNNSNTFYQ